MQDIETGQQQASPHQSALQDADCLALAGALTSASSAPSDLDRQALAGGNDAIAGSPLNARACSSNLSNDVSSPQASPNGQSHAPGMLGKLLSAGGRSMKRSPSGSQPVCLICLENLTSEDFEVAAMTHVYVIFVTLFFFGVCLACSKVMLCQSD
ncbi:MAG: hypothetical protein O7C59_10540, partial [Rickettsia endosymbiont of Ixodes persulcatus]|nr:hypothetical protein [Rickettsia endosymbiont of Ixodes persulcatus]